jgi:restriction system protein
MDEALSLLGIEAPEPFAERFVGREVELARLGDLLFGSAPRAVCVTGLFGIGKSALAARFASLHRNAFPGGIHVAIATPFESLVDTVERNVSNSADPYLLILDGLELRPQEAIATEFITLRRRHRNARLLATARYSPARGTVDDVLALPPLSPLEAAEFLAQLPAVRVSPDHLYAATLGNPRSITVAMDLLRQAVVTPSDLLRRFQAFTSPGVIISDDLQKPVAGVEHARIQADVVQVSREFFRRLHENPDLLYELTPRGFEDLVAELLHRLNYEVTLTPASRDGGKDIYAAKKDHLGTFLYIVECKRYARDRRVGVGLVRQLNGVVQAEQATAGILATTSFFTQDAKEFQRTLAFQISLKDYIGIQEWLDAVLNAQPPPPNNRLQRPAFRRR